MSPQKPEEDERMKKVHYKEALGCLQYIAQATRPDISYAVNAVSEFNSNPGPKHWDAVKRILRYLKRTASNRLRYSKQGNGELWCYLLERETPVNGSFIMLRS
ncbi:uncharacterized protein LOC129742345 [Uranotaenia lowii]|uniref:uncharacterized protein LOC129742345 n=1 Tax=Uranotaenia lowii TaxID=190385 RepID=UPI0024797D31|nr:uncharacterized protein LOC129742345 [Uranotaenia lowii]